MKIKVFLIVCIGSAIMLTISSALLLTQMHSMQSVNLDQLTDSLYKEDSKVLTWILSTIPVERIETMSLPESWAEIFAVNNSDLKLTTSTNKSHNGMALYNHPLLLDQGSIIMNAIKSKKSIVASTKDYQVIVQMLGPDQSIIALKPKTWEKKLVSDQDNQLKESVSGIFKKTVLFIAIGFCITFLVAFVIMKIIVAPTSNALDALKALSLGDFDYDFKMQKSKEMEKFTESYLRLKTSLEMALERISRR